jgi:hypothetical protein
VPGELNGLTQAALALSAPAVAGADGDGLLTMEEILALKLNADWVVLLACNTGSGAGAGAEAASGLGRAFLLCRHAGASAARLVAAARTAAFRSSLNARPDRADGGFGGTNVHGRDLGQPSIGGCDTWTVE